MPPWLAFRFSLPGLPPIESDLVMGSPQASALLLDSGIINGQHLGPEDRAIVVQPEEQITGVLWLHVRNAWEEAAVLLVRVPSWGDRTRNFRPLLALPVRTLREPVEISIDLPGPREPGAHWIALVAGAETEARYLASGTNWLLGSPRWYDGNDIADLDAEQIRALNEPGGMLWPFDGVQGSPRGLSWIFGTVLEVLVR